MAQIAVCAALLAPTARASSQSLEQDVAAELATLRAKSSVFAKHLPSGREVAIRADEPMNTLSVIKIPVMIVAFREMEAGRLSLTARHPIRPEDLRRGSGLIQTFDVGLEPTYRDLIEQMIITSDNTATDIMIRVVGLERINQFLAARGFKETRLKGTTGDLFREVWVRFDPQYRNLTDREVFVRGFPNAPRMGELSFALEGDSTKWLGRTTAREMSRLLEEMAAGRYTSAEHAEQMVAIMKRQLYSSRLPQRLQWRSPVEVAHKTGDWPPIAGNDVGILFYQGGPTVVSVFTNQNRGDFFELEAAIGRIAERLVAAWR